ncbi:MAG: Asp-tRNA(Asn)/Glu-tRNA(Gln) amidotransferase subunit GatB, partial [Pseudomonadota bacterium]
EQDAGKSIHDQSPTQSFIDLNRAGVGLMEIVSKPDLRCSTEAVAYMKKLRSILIYLGTCDGDMEKGSLRCDANVSIRKRGAPLGTRVELKNINSFKFIAKAIEYEAQRQLQAITSGEIIIQQTRLFDPSSGITKKMRDKEDALDYRYFPDPDLPQVILTDEFISNIKNNLPELPDQKIKRYTSNYSLSYYDAEVLTNEPEIATYFEQVVTTSEPKLAANWVSSELFGLLNKHNIAIENSPIKPNALAELLGLISDGTISGKIAKQVFEEMFNSNKGAKAIVEERGLVQLSDPEQIKALIQHIINDNPEKVEQYRAGKDKLFGYFVGQVMKQSGGKANPKIANEILKMELG